MPETPDDISLIQNIAAVSHILDVVCRTTGMGFAAVARVTDTRWIACSVLDNIQFGLLPGGELELESTICHEIREHQQLVAIKHVAEDPLYKDHHTPRRYGFQSYISTPIHLPDGRFFGTLCAIDPKPADVGSPAVTGMFMLFAELIAFHIEAQEKFLISQAALLTERENSLLREQFIAVLGHDLRNPLSAVIMGTELLKEAELPQDTRPLVEMMAGGAHRMSALIDDVMDFARGRLGDGISPEHRQTTLLEPLLNQVVGEIRTTWPAREIQTSFAVGQPVECDPPRLSQLIGNLLSNAMHHGTAERPVQVAPSDATGCLVISVSNAAPRIAPEILGRLFDPFSRGETDARKDGLGLGLYIASQIARSHGGALEVHSDEEETRFTFSMPLVPARPAAE